MDNQKPGPSKRLERAKSDLLPSRSTENFKSKIRQVKLGLYKCIYNFLT